MKVKHFLKILGAVTLAVFLTSCAAKSPSTSPVSPVTEYSCTGNDLNPKIQSNELIGNVDNTLVILDASSTMADKTVQSWHVKQRKFPLAKDLIKCMNQTIPDISLNSGMRGFGPYHSEKGLIYGMTGYAKAGLHTAVNGFNSTGGITPIANAIHYGRMDLEETTGKTAVILFSDGKNNVAADPIAAAADMKDQFGRDLCIYTVLLGDDPKGRATMEGIAKAGECGFATDAEALMAQNGMNDFVTRVFLAKGSGPRDMDGDGVFDHLDKCPKTPKGAKVDSAGCPLPLEKTVSITLHVQFDFDKAVVKPEYKSNIKKVADFLIAYPDTNAVLKGHTDSRGSEDYNHRLSHSRAESVKQYLVDNFGISAARITAKGLGESKPVATNETEEGRYKNRRVVADIMATVKVQ